jgi:hypothetical protein
MSGSGQVLYPNRVSSLARLNAIHGTYAPRPVNHPARFESSHGPSELPSGCHG